MPGEASIIDGSEIDAVDNTVPGSIDGVVRNPRGTMTLPNSSVSGNQTNGILAVTASTIRLLGVTVTANGGDGGWLAAEFSGLCDGLFAVSTC